MTRACPKPPAGLGTVRPQVGTSEHPCARLEFTAWNHYLDMGPRSTFPMGEHSLDLDYIFSSAAYFLTCRSPSLPGVKPLCSLWSTNPRAGPFSPHGGSREPDSAGRDGVCHWQGLLRSQDGSQCQGLFVCLQERLIWHSSKIVTKAGSQDLPLPVHPVQNWVSREKILREGVCSFFFSSNVATSLFYFMR